MRDILLRQTLIERPRPIGPTSPYPPPYPRRKIRYAVVAAFDGKAAFIATLTVRNLDQDVVRRLRIRAAGASAVVAADSPLSGRCKPTLIRLRSAWCCHWTLGRRNGQPRMCGDEQVLGKGVGAPRFDARFHGGDPRQRPLRGRGSAVMNPWVGRGADSRLGTEPMLNRYALDVIVAHVEPASGGVEQGAFGVRRSPAPCAKRPEEAVG